MDMLQVVNYENVKIRKYSGSAGSEMLRPDFNGIQLRLEAAKGEITKLLNERYHTVGHLRIFSPN